ncbi:MAG: ribosomal protein [Candidatus Saccharibacteria bacterium]|nr:ribosomal protein [Candidatus Saccharibacteria bacterium]
MSIITTDPIADMLTRIRNAIGVRKHTVTMPHSNLKEAVAKVLKDQNFVDGYSVDNDASGYKVLTVNINSEDSNARITEIERLSRPGRRWYSSSEEIPVVKRGRGIVVVSTSKGLMIGKDAKQQHLGGELICKVF